MTCFICPHGQGQMCSGGCGLCGDNCAENIGREEEETQEEITRYGYGSRKEE